MKRLKFFVIFILALLFFTKTVAAMETVTEKIHVRILPKQYHDLQTVKHYKKLVNLLNRSNVWVTNKAMWDQLGVQGRIVDLGILVNPYEVPVFENDSGVAKMSVYTYKYLTAQDIISGTSNFYLRLPIAVNITSFNMQINISVQIFRVQDVKPAVFNFNYSSIYINTYNPVNEILSINGTLSKLSHEWCGITVENYTYPANITNLTLSIFYMHLHLPIFVGYSYIILQYIQVPDFKKHPLYVLTSYKNETARYYSETGSVYYYPLPSLPQFALLARSGISNGIFSTHVKKTDYSYIISRDKTIDMHGSNFNASLIMPVYSVNASSLTVRMYFLFKFRDDGTRYNFTFIKTFDLQPGANTIFFNVSKPFPWYVVETAGYQEYNKLIRAIIQFVVHDKGIYFYAINSNEKYVYYNETTNIININETYNITYASNGIATFHLLHPWHIFYYQTDILYYLLASANSSIAIQPYNFAGINRPQIIVHTTYVYDLLDIPVGMYKAGMFIITNFIYYVTFGYVDLRWLYSDNFILSVAKGIRDWLDWGKGLIGGFIDTLLNVVVPLVQWSAYWVLNFILFILNIAAYVFFLWPWMVLSRGTIALQERGVDAMLDYFSAYVDRVTSVMARLLRGVRPK